MYYNPMASIFLRLLGQAAAASFADQSQRNASASQQEDDTPIDVEAQVVDEDGKTASDRAHDQWDANRKQTQGHELGGKAVFAGSKSYNIACGVISILVLIAGIVLRIYSLIMGQIFSATVVHVALGAIGAAVMAFAAGAAIWKLGAWKLSFDVADTALVFLSAALMGYANLPCALIAAAVGALWMRVKKDGKLPFFAPYIVCAIVAKIAFGYPGLVV